MGFDDSQVAQMMPPGLTSVRQPLEQVAVEIVARTERLLATPAAAQPTVCMLTPHAWCVRGLAARSAATRG